MIRQLPIWIALALLPFASGCDSFASASVVTKWKGSRHGIVLKQQGDEVSGQMFMLAEDTGMIPEEMLAQMDEFEMAMPLSYGLYNADKNSMLFPLNNVTLVQVTSFRRLVESGERYVEVDLSDLEGDRIVGEWRKGNNPPYNTDEFIRYEK